MVFEEWVGPLVSPFLWFSVVGFVCSPGVVGPVSGIGCSSVGWVVLHRQVVWWSSMSVRHWVDLWDSIVCNFAGIGSVGVHYVGVQGLSEKSSEKPIWVSHRVPFLSTSLG